MADPGFAVFDADNHYYEATDAFTRHIDPSMAKRAMQWAEINGRTRLVVAGRVNRFIPNPTFDPVARPGALDDYFRGRTAGDDIRSAFGELEPIHPGYRDPAARIEIMDRQGMEACFMFPTLGVGMEEALTHDPVAAHAAFHAFNQWLHDDWGFDHEGRIFAAPYLCLLDPDRAVAEIDWVLERGARVIVMRAGPVLAPTGGRSPGDPVYDPFWQRIDDAGITVAYHSGDAGYGRYAADWGESDEMEAFRRSTFKAITTSDRPISDTLTALICHGVFRRFPNVRVATIESGSEWVPGLLKKLAKSWKQTPALYDGQDPVEQFRRHVWVAPYYEDDIVALVDAIGADHVLFGSDWPHAEGLADPRSFIDDLAGLSDEAIRLIMRDNGLALAQPRPNGSRRPGLGFGKAAHDPVEGAQQGDGRRPNDERVDAGQGR
jgi:predicted TIM-barrel fold metal-dependent hydrolase